MSGVAHLAGPDLTVDGRYMRQRCSWCGAILIDYDLTMVSVPTGQDGPSFYGFGKWVEVTDGNPRIFTTLDWEGEKLPPTSCMRWPVEETR